MRGIGLVVVIVGVFVASWPCPGAESAVLAGGFTDTVVLSGATQPTVVRFLPSGGAYVSEKSGRIVFYKSFGSPPRVVADLSTEVYSAGDHGLLGMAIDPSYPSQPYLY